MLMKMDVISHWQCKWVMWSVLYYSSDNPTVPLDVKNSMTASVIFVTYMQPDLSLCLSAISNSLLASRVLICV